MRKWIPFRVHIGGSLSDRGYYVGLWTRRYGYRIELIVSVPLRWGHQLSPLVVKHSVFNCRQLHFWIRLLPWPFIFACDLCLYWIRLGLWLGVDEMDRLAALECRLRAEYDRRRDEG